MAEFSSHHLQDDKPEQEGFRAFSRRSFLLSTAAFTSCSAATHLIPDKDQVKASANSGYRTPSVSGPVPRNPDMPHGSNFSRQAGITFTKVPVSGKFIAMTFDDGPHPKNTPRLLDILRARNIKATFYVIGRSVDTHPDVLRRTVAEGHEIGNHTYTHPLLTKLSDSAVRRELDRCKESVSKAAGIGMRTMRPPYGGLLQRQRQLVLDEYGYPTILWSADPLDWKRPGASVITSRILSNTAAGGIVLAHDLHAQTVDAMPATLDGLLRKGFQFVTVSQLIAMKQETSATRPSGETASS